MPKGYPGGQPAARGQTAFPRRHASAADLDEVRDALRSKANASTVGGMAMAMDAKATRDELERAVPVAVQGVIGFGGTAVIAFGRHFDVTPCVVFSEVSGSSAQPAVFRVESWIRHGDAYSGCVVRAWRFRPLPAISPVAGVLSAVISGMNMAVAALTGFNAFAAPVEGAEFSCIAMPRTEG